MSSSLQVLSTFRRYAIQRFLEAGSACKTEGTGEGERERERERERELVPPAIQGLLQVSPSTSWELPHVLFVNPCRFTSNLWIEILLRQCIIGRDRLSDQEDLVKQSVQQEYKGASGSKSESHTIEFYSHPHFIDINVHRAFQDDLSVVCAFLKTILDTRHVTGQRRVVILRDVGDMSGHLGHLALAHMLDSQEALVWMTCASSSHIHPKLLSRCMIVRTHATWGLPSGKATLVHDFLAECMGLDAEHDPRVLALVKSIGSTYPDVVKCCIQLEITQDPSFIQDITLNEKSKDQGSTDTEDTEDTEDAMSACPPPAPEAAWILFLRSTLDRLCEKAKANRQRGNARANPVKNHHYHEVRDLVGILLKNAIPFPMIARVLLEIYADAYAAIPGYAQQVATLCAETDALLATSSQKDLFALELFFIKWIDLRIRS